MRFQIAANWLYCPAKASAFECIYAAAKGVGIAFLEERAAAVQNIQIIKIIIKTVCAYHCAYVR